MDSTFSLRNLTVGRKRGLDPLEYFMEYFS